MATTLLHLLDHPRLRRVIVVASVPEQQDRRLGVDVLAISLPEHLERVPVVAVAVDPDDVCLRVDPMDRLADVLGGLEVARHLVDAVDEDEGTDLGELPLDRIDEHEGEPREGGHAAGDVGHDHQFGLGWPRILELRVGGHAAVAQ